MSLCNIAQIAVEGAGSDFDRLYDYLIPDHMLSDIRIGYRVLVPFGTSKKLRQGFVFSLKLHCEISNLKRYKEIAQICDAAPLLNQNGVDLARWLCERTFCSLYEAARAMLPAGLCMRAKLTYTVEPDLPPDEFGSLAGVRADIVKLLSSHGGYLSTEQISKKLGIQLEQKTIDELVTQGFLRTNYEASSRLGGKTRRTAVLNAEAEEKIPSISLTAKQRLVVETLREIGTAAVNELCYYTGVTASVVFALENRGILTLQEQRYDRLPSAACQGDGVRTPIRLTDEQNIAFQSLRSDLFSDEAACSLLFGVTGSGKTSVYTRLIDEAVDNQLSVILMVPEIALTPQTLSLYYARYGSRVAVFHSGLSAGERVDEWRRVKQGQAQIAIGTRSAVFAPFERVDLIIIDEEQEHTYKSERTPRYHAVEVAKYICARDKGTLLLASATPSVESYAYAKSGRYRLLTLSRRYGASALPEVELVDLSQSPGENSCMLSGRMIECLDQNLAQKKQSILLMNRRGYHTFIVCSSCKKTVTCPSCSISLTYHRSNNRLMCHYCGYSQPVVEVCPSCGEKTVRYSGCGTQKIEEELGQLFPQARILRMDADTTMAKNAYEQKLNDFAAGKYDILIGTQMVAKGLDFPHVTLVGVLSAELGLFRDDYRSGERAFDLLTQVVGRAGRRAEKGLALIQTLSPENEVIQYAAAQDYEKFFSSEIDNRKVMIYPPFCDICMIGCSSESDPAAKAAAHWFLAQLKEYCSGAYADQKLIVIGPNPSVIHRIGNKYRYRLLIKCKNSKRFRALIRTLLQQFSKNKISKTVTAFADINPVSMF